MVRVGMDSRRLWRSAARSAAGLFVALAVVSAAPARALASDPEELVTVAPAPSIRTIPRSRTRSRA